MAAIFTQGTWRTKPNNILRRWFTTNSNLEPGIGRALEQLHPGGDHSERYAELLRYCTRRRSLGDGKLVHDHIARNGYSGNYFLGNLLVDMYGKCGDPDSARAAFESIQEKNLYSWTILVTALSKSGHSREVFKVVERMDLEGIKAEKIAYLGLVDACAKLLDRNRSKEVHSRIAQLGWCKCPVVGNAVVSMHGKCGDLEAARRAFELLEEKGVVSWNAVIGAYAKNGFGKEALMMLKRMDQEGVEPDRITFLSVVEACTSLGSLPESRLAYARILAKGLGVDDVAVGTSLVNMFGKCRSLGDAKAAFDHLRHKNVVSWNVMIQAYTQSGSPEQALRLFREIPEEVEPDEVTFINAIDACVGLKFLADGKEIHERITNRGLDTDLVLGNALMNMYSKCSSPSDAREVFNRMRNRDLVSWNTLIAAYARNEFGKEGIRVFQEMILIGMAPDKYTFISALDACCSLESGGARRGRGIHQLIGESPCFSDVALGTALIKMYGKVELVGEARRVFDSMGRRVSLTWGRMITAYGQNGFGREAIDLYKRMDLEPDKMTYASVIDACSGVMEIEEGRRVHSRIIESKLETDLVLDNTLLDLYGLSGSLADAKQVFDGMRERDVISWNAILRAHIYGDRPKEALSLFYEMEEAGVKPDRVSYVSALDACSAIGGSDGLLHGRGIHRLVIANKVHFDLFVGTALVTMYGRCGSQRDAELVFGEMRSRNAITWTSMIRGYSCDGFFRDAMLTFHRMELEGCAPDKISLIAVLEAARGLDDARAGRKIHARLEELGFSLDPAVQSALLSMYGKCGCLEIARVLFDGMEEPCVVSWNSMIAAYARSGDKREVLELFDAMLRRGVEPTRATYLGVLNVGFASFSNDEARGLGDRARAGGLDTDCLVGTALLNMEMRFGRIGEARRLFDKLELRDLVSWTSMIVAYASQGDGGEALELFKEMQLEGICPDDVLFIGVLFACSHGGRFAEGWELFVMMVGEYEIEALAEHYCCLVDLLGRAGKLPEAEDLILGMPFKPDEATWTSLIGNCKVHGDVERAERVSKAMELEQQQESSSSAAAAPQFLLLSNTLAEASTC